jgi:hypothetical protein
MLSHIKIFEYRTSITSSIAPAPAPTSHLTSHKPQPQALLSSFFFLLSPFFFFFLCPLLLVFCVLVFIDFLVFGFCFLSS